jgi:hypothetical protein
MSAQRDPVLEALWKRVTDDWDAEPAHHAFLEYCRASEQLVEAAVRYRGMSGDHARAELAEKKLKAVALLALSRLEASRSEPAGATVYRGSYALIALFLLATVGLLAYLGATR